MNLDGFPCEAPGFFVTGTDTGVGKTHVTTAWLRHAARAGVCVSGMKPIACGDRDDAVRIAQATGDASPLDLVNPVHFASPVAPLLAARLESRDVDFLRISSAFHALRAACDFILVEGVGGWLTPIAPRCTGAQFARMFDLPVVVVAANRLGALNHTLLTVEAIHASGMRCAGVILNAISPEDAKREGWLAESHNGELLSQLLPVPVLGALPFEEPPV